MIYLNDGTGNFTIHSEWSKQVFTEGITTDAQWEDYDNDGDSDLVIVGHWSPVTICENLNPGFNCRSIPNTKGLWNTVKFRYLDGDAQADIVAGNYGLNSQLKADSLNLLKLFYEDL